MTRPEKALDQALRDERKVTADVVPLVEAARDLEERLDTEAPASARERAIFIEGVAARGHRRRPRLLAPVLAGTALVFLLGFAAGAALPGDAIYPVRKVMASVGLVASPAEEMRSLLRGATTRITDAEALQSRSPSRARTQAFAAIGMLEDAAQLAGDLSAQQRGSANETIAGLRERAAAVVAFVTNTTEDDSGSGGGSSGRGSGDDDDSSGPGSGDDDDDDGDDDGDDD